MRKRRLLEKEKRKIEKNGTEMIQEMYEKLNYYFFFVRKEDWMVKK